MNRQLVRATVSIATWLMVWIPAATFADDSWAGLQEQRFKLQQQIPTQEFKVQQVQIRSTRISDMSLRSRFPSLATPVLPPNPSIDFPSRIGGLDQGRTHMNPLPASSEMSRWASGLRNGMQRDVSEWARDRVVGAIDQGFVTPNLPERITQVRTWFDRVQSACGWAQWTQQLRSPPSNPNEALDSLKPIASLGGPVSPLVVPLLKGYYGLVFDNLSRVGTGMSSQAARISYVQGVTPLRPVPEVATITTRTELASVSTQTRITYTPTNSFDRALVNANLISPRSLYDPMTSTTTLMRQSSITTREIASPIPNISQNLGNWSRLPSIASVPSISPVAINYTNPITNRAEVMNLSPQNYSAWQNFSQRNFAAQQRFGQLASSHINMSQMSAMNNLNRNLGSFNNYSFQNYSFQQPTKWSIPSTSYSAPYIPPVQPIKIK